MSLFHTPEIGLEGWLDTVSFFVHIYNFFFFKLIYIHNGIGSDHHLFFCNKTCGARFFLLCIFGSIRFQGPSRFRYYIVLLALFLHWVFCISIFSFLFLFNRSIFLCL